MWVVWWVLLCLLAACLAAAQRSDESLPGLDDVVEEAEGLEMLHTLKDRVVVGSDIELAVSRGWFELSKALLTRGQAQGSDLSRSVRSSVLALKKNADELLRHLESGGQEMPVVSAAFQWAQSNTTIFIQVKFAHRWSSPGALSVEDEEVVAESCCLRFSGVGDHSMRKKKYHLALEFFDLLDETLTEWSFGSVGKLHVTLQKKSPGPWPRLTKGEKKLANGHVWWEMKAKLEEEERKAYDATTTTTTTTARPTATSRPSKPSGGTKAVHSNGGRKENESQPTKIHDGSVEL